MKPLRLEELTRMAMLASKPLIRLAFTAHGRALTESAQKSIVPNMNGLTTLCGGISREIIS
jgi:hypothetical protein